MNNRKGAGVPPQPPLPADESDLFREAVGTFVRVQVGKRLAALGGRARDMVDVPRRREVAALK